MHTNRDLHTHEYIQTHTETKISRPQEMTKKIKFPGAGEMAETQECCVYPSRGSSFDFQDPHGSPQPVPGGMTAIYGLHRHHAYM